MWRPIYLDNYKQTLSALRALLIWGAISTILTGCVTPPTIQETPIATSEPPSSAPSSDIEVFGLPEPPIFLGEQVGSIEEAQSRVGFPIAVASVLPEGYELIWIGTSSPEVREAEGGFVRLVYSDGEHHIIMGQGLANESEVKLLEEEETLARHHLQKITIGGQPGMVREGGTFLVPRLYDQKLVPIELPPYLRWWPPGMTIAIWSEDDMSLRLADLIAMAESMEPAQ